MLVEEELAASHGQVVDTGIAWAAGVDEGVEPPAIAVGHMHMIELNIDHCTPVIRDFAILICDATALGDLVLATWS